MVVKRLIRWLCACVANVAKLWPTRTAPLQHFPEELQSGAEQARLVAQLAAVLPPSEDTIRALAHAMALTDAPLDGV